MKTRINMTGIKTKKIYKYIDIRDLSELDSYDFLSHCASMLYLSNYCNIVSAVNH